MPCMLKDWEAFDLTVLQTRLWLELEWGPFGLAKWEINQAGTLSFHWHCLLWRICIADPKAGEVKHLTFISIWPQWACKQYNEEKSVEEAIQLQSSINTAKGDV